MLLPYAGAPDLSDPGLTGEWAAGMGAVADHVQTPPWCSYVAWRGDEASGLGAFKGGPDAEGVVEIAYMTFVEMRGRGVATEIAAALIELAEVNAVRGVRAHTLPAENRSTRVLLAHGFAQVGTVVDPEDGPVWRWERHLRNTDMP